jgi:TPR repeat protein
MICRLLIGLFALFWVQAALAVNSDTLNKGRAGDVDAQFWLAVQYFNEKNFTEGVKWMRKAAEGGKAQAQFGLAEIYMRGVGTLAKDPEAARQWATRAAEQEWVEAQMFLAQGEHKGIFGKVDEDAARRWLRRAAGNGNQDAQMMWGMALIQGGDVPQDKVQGAHWLLQAARQGHKQAILGLASSYFNGEFTPKNPMMGVYLIRVGVHYKLPEAEKAWAQMQKQDAKGTEQMERLVRVDREAWGPIVTGTDGLESLEKQLASVAQLWLTGKGLVQDIPHAMKLLEEIVESTQPKKPSERLQMTALRAEASRLLGRYNEDRGRSELALDFYLRAAAGENKEGLQRLCELSGLSYAAKTDTCDLKVADPGVISAQMKMLEQWAIKGVPEAYRLLADLHMRSGDNPRYSVAHQWHCAGERYLGLRGVVGSAALQQLASEADYREGEKLAYEWLMQHPRDLKDREMDNSIIKRRGAVCR